VGRQIAPTPGKACAACAASPAQGVGAIAGNGRRSSAAAAPVASRVRVPSPVTVTGRGNPRRAFVAEPAPHPGPVVQRVQLAATVGGSSLRAPVAIPGKYVRWDEDCDSELVGGRYDPAIGHYLLYDVPPFVVRGYHAADFSDVDTFIQSYMEANGIGNGALAIVASDGRLVLARGYTSPINTDFLADEPCTEPDSKFRVASVSKIFTALATMALAEDYPATFAIRHLLRDHLDLTPLGGTLLNSNWNRITIEHLLSHVSGLATQDLTTPGQEHTPDYYLKRSDKVAQYFGVDLPIDDAHMLEFITTVGKDAANKPTGMGFVQTPGSVRAYANINFYLLGLVIEAVSGESLASYVRRRICKPLGLSRTRYAGTTLAERQANEVRYYYGSNARAAESSGAVTPGNCSSVNVNYAWSQVEGRYDGDSGQVIDQPCTLYPYGGRRDYQLQRADAGTVTTALDLVRLMRSLVESRRAASPILSEASIAAMVEDHFPGQAKTAGLAYGYGLYFPPRRGDEGAFYHSGNMEGTHACAYAYPPASNTSNSLPEACVAFVFNRNAWYEDQDQGVSQGSGAEQSPYNSALFQYLLYDGPRNLLQARAATDWGSVDLFHWL
jgi:CubicO group peptidase (beta-lactamase class C family)